MQTLNANLECKPEPCLAGAGFDRGLDRGLDRGFERKPQKLKAS
jgi:hypothetical protein